MTISKRYALIMFMSTLALNSTICPAQDSFSGLLSDLDNLERQLQAPQNPSAPLVHRLSALEQRLFGAPRYGSMVERLNSLKAAAREIPSRSPAPGSPGVNSAWGGSQPKVSGPTGADRGQVQALGGKPAADCWAPNSAAGGWIPMPPQTIPGQGAATAAGGWIPNQQQSVPAQGTLTAGGGWTPMPPQTIPGQGAATAAGGWIPNQQQTVPAQGASTAVAQPVLRKNFGSDAFPLLNAFPPNIVRMEPDATALIARPDYYNEVLKASKGKAIRYKNMPIPVYVQPYPDGNFVRCVILACESWEFRTNGEVRFSQVSSPNQARIQVVWKRLGASKDSSGCLLGAHTILKYTSRGNGSLSFMSVGAVPLPVYIPRKGPKYTVPPQVMEVNLDLINTKEPSVKYPCLQNIVTHEFGHALGLLGHSPNQADIMYPVTDENSRISQRDLNTLHKLYSQKCDLPL